MSYLPRMSKTYKEPKPVVIEDEKEANDISYNIIKPASSLLAEGTHNPQMALKHYRYVPHPLPVLPGPSVFAEAIENEISREASRLRRSSDKIEKLATASETTPELPATEETQADNKLEEMKDQVKRTSSRKTVKRTKSGLGKRKSSKLLLDKKKENPSMADDIKINMCLVGSVVKKSFLAAQTDRQSRNVSEDSELLKQEDRDLLKREASLVNVNRRDLFPKKETAASATVQKNVSDEHVSKEQRKQFTNRSVQCTIFGSSKKTFVVPLVMTSLLRSLAFLLHELNREEITWVISGERKSLMTQVQLILGDLCNQKIQKEFGFDITYSDSKRLEKILGDLQTFLKDVYGDKGEYVDRMEDLKRVFVDLKRKEMELNLLKSKLTESEELDTTESALKEINLKNPEITLQNKRLESEQLLAEVEFSCRELRDYQKKLAEIDWDIKKSQDQMTSLKKSIASKSKTEILGKKSSVYKFSNEALSKGNKSKENENHLKKKI